MGKYCGHIPASYLCCAYGGFEGLSYSPSSTQFLNCSGGSSFTIILLLLFLICGGVIIVVVTGAVAFLVYRQKKKQSFENVDEYQTNDNNVNNTVGEVDNGYGTI